MHRAQDVDLDDPYLVTWTQRWQHPRLLAELERQSDTVEPDPAAQAAAMLQDLARPPRNLDASVLHLIETGDLKAAERLVDDTGLLEQMGMDPAAAQEAVHAAQAAARLNRRRDEAGLDARAVAAGVQLSRDPASRPAAEQVSKGVQDLVESIEETLRTQAFDDDFTDLIRACLTAGQYAAARQLLAAGPAEEVIGGPALVRQTRPWPYETPVRTVLGWFDPAAETPRDFGTRKPLPDDTTGHAVVTALRAVHAQLDAASARDLADALDGLFDDGVLTHRPTEVPGGFAVQLFGLEDPRLPWLGLPRRPVLTIGTLPPPPSDEVGIWLSLADPAPTGAGSAVAVVTPRQLLELIAPTSRRRSGSLNHRRINLLRMLCRTLDATSVIRGGAVDLGVAAEMREAVTWMLDMLGLRTTDTALPEVLLFDAAHLSPAVCAIVRELGSRVRRPGDVTLADLAAVRTDPAAVRRIREVVEAPLDGDVNALTVLGILMLQQPAREVAAIELAKVQQDVKDFGDGLTPEVDTGHVDVVGAVRLLSAAGLVTVLAGPDGAPARVRLCGDGLAALLGGEVLRSDTEARLRTLHEQAEESERAARIALANQTSHAHRHLYDNYTFIQGQLISELGRDDLPPDRRHVLNVRAKRVEARIATLRRAQDGRFADLEVREFDLRDTLDEFRRLHDYVGCPAKPEVVFDDHALRRLPVRGLEELVQLALDDLVVNAHRAMDRAESIDRRIRVDVRVQERAIERVVVLDIQDSGPGFDGLTEPDHERARAGLRGGDGIANAATVVRSCRGELQRMPDRAPLGGGHVRVTLPLTE